MNEPMTRRELADFHQQMHDDANTKADARLVADIAARLIAPGWLDMDDERFVRLSAQAVADARELLWLARESA